MEIQVAQISEDEGLDIHHLYPEGEPPLSEDAQLVGRTELDLQATRAAEKVRLVGSLNATVGFECGRCLTPLSANVEQSFELLYLPPLGAGDEHELHDDDLAIAFYQGDAIDLDDLVREQVELALPMTRLCSEACRGLCAECGANLNQGDCACATEATDPRWAALKDLTGH
ncbi:MAG: YceD family protein [Blastocatellia bacterium]